MPKPWLRPFVNTGPGKFYVDKKIISSLLSFKVKYNVNKNILIPVAVSVLWGLGKVWTDI